MEDLTLNIDTSGFYSVLNDQLIHAPNDVINSKYELHRSKKDEYKYPVHGWSWFDNQDSASKFFNIEIPTDNFQIEPIWPER